MATVAARAIASRDFKVLHSAHKVNLLIVRISSCNQNVLRRVFSMPPAAWRAMTAATDVLSPEAVPHRGRIWFPMMQKIVNFIVRRPISAPFLRV